MNWSWRFESDPNLSRRSAVQVQLDIQYIIMFWYQTQSLAWQNVVRLTQTQPLGKQRKLNVLTTVSSQLVNKINLWSVNSLLFAYHHTSTGSYVCSETNPIGWLSSFYTMANDLHVFNFPYDSTNFYSPQSRLLHINGLHSFECEARVCVCVCVSRAWYSHQFHSASHPQRCRWRWQSQRHSTDLQNNPTRTLLFSGAVSVCVCAFIFTVSLCLQDHRCTSVDFHPIICPFILLSSIDPSSIHQSSINPSSIQPSISSASMYPSVYHPSILLLCVM